MPSKSCGACRYPRKRDYLPDAVRHEFERRVGRLVYVAVRELSHDNQALMLIGHERHQRNRKRPRRNAQDDDDAGGSFLISAQVNRY
jgi:hypothetical protein